MRPCSSGWIGPTWSVLRRLVELAAQLSQRRERPGLHRAEWDPELLGDPHLSHATEVRHLEHLSLFEREVLQRKADLVAAPLEEVFLGDALRRVFARDGLEVRRPLLPGSESLLPTDRVHAAVVHEREEEGSERA